MNPLNKLNEKKLSSLIRLIISSLIILVGLAWIFLTMQIFKHNETNRTNKVRYETYLLADQLRQSSDDLTKMVRLYTVTGEERFEKFYWEIQAIREGNMPRPLNYERIYWDFMVSEASQPPFQAGERKSLIRLMKKAGFTEQELNLLEQAKKNSDDLILLEKIAMQAVKGIFQDEKGDFTVHKQPNLELAKEIVFGSKYHEAKRNIMAPINDFFESIDQRTQQLVEKERFETQVYQILIMIVFFLIFVLGTTLYFLIHHHEIKLMEALKIAQNKEIQELYERNRVELELEASNRELEKRSITDGLTGLANRRHFDDTFNYEHLRHIRSRDKLSIIMMDIDFFKKYNDFYGHVEGDKCLQKVAGVISGSLERPVDLAARYGGEEFICILPDTNLDGALVIANKIQLQMFNIMIPHEKSLVSDHVTLSIGIKSDYCIQGKSTTNMITEVDELLYRAKTNGRNRIEYDKLSPEMVKISEQISKLERKKKNDCGNSVIDQQHKFLFDVLNSVFDSIISKIPREQILPHIENLLDKTIQHFHDEEKYMEELNYAELDDHLAIHQEVLSEARICIEQYKNEKTTSEQMFLTLAFELLIPHFQEQDVDFLSITNHS